MSMTMLRSVVSRFFAATQTAAHPARQLSFSAPKLPLLTKMGELAKAHGLPGQEKTAVIGVQHLLATTASMFDVMMDINGVPPENMFFTGKCYSTSPQVLHYLQERGIRTVLPPFPRRPSDYQQVAEDSIRRLWEDFRQHVKERGIDHAIILTDGGLPGILHPTLASPKLSWSAVEQTRFGLYSPTVDIHSYPLINVAQSAVKIYAESVVVTETGIKKIESVLNRINFKEDQIYGIVGYGAVGHALAKYLLDHGYRVAVHEVDNVAFTKFGHLPCRRISSLKELVTLSDCVFGCTGTDITAEINVRNLVQADKFFISFSSGNIEFLSLLREIRDNSLEVRPPLEDIVCSSTRGNNIYILNGGYPVTFDGSGFAMQQEDSALTLALMLGAYYQARVSSTRVVDDTSAINSWQNYMLDPTMQKAIFSWWIRGQEHRFPSYVVEGLQDEEWIKAHSKGVYQPNPWLTACFKDLLEEIPRNVTRLII